MSAEEMELGTGSEGMDDGEMMDEDFGESDYDFPLNKEKNVTEDGGVTKTVLSEGSGYERPEKGDQVEVHYVGTLLDGTQFDSSRDRGTPFSFGLGKGEVIKGWDGGVKTMLKGEKAILQCKPEYAYGASGSPPTIPPDSTLKFEVELLSWKSVKDISGDGGVIKKTMKEGTGWENPKDKDEVCVKYEVRLDGSSEVVASSGETGKEFVLHEGHFCKALPIAVKKMKEGEKAMLTVQPDYGFGAEGQPPRIPPDATLTINLELVSWKTVENVTDDGAVVKKILKKGEGYDKPREGARASLRYTGRLLDGTIFEERAEGNEHEIVVDEEQVIDGLDLAIMKMVKKEVAEITVQPSYGFGDEETQKDKAIVPAGSTVQYTVELVDLENPKNTWDMSNEEKVEDSRLKKEKGNEAYKQGKLQKAVKRYDAAIKSIEYDKDFGEAKNAAKDLKKAIWLNLAAANLKLDEFSKAIENCGKVLEIDTSNVKALYRRSQAYMGRGDYIEAELDIKKARSNDPNNKDILIFMRKMKEKIKAASKQEAKLYSTMFSKMAKLKDQEQDEGKSVNVENSGSDGKDAGPSGEPVQEAAAGPSS